MSIKFSGITCHDTAKLVTKPKLVDFSIEKSVQNVFPILQYRVVHYTACVQLTVTWLCSQTPKQWR